MDYRAHTKGIKKQEWEILFTPFGESPELCHRDDCPACETIAQEHGHLNKVAWWTAKFAGLLATISMNLPENK